MDSNLFSLELFAMKQRKKNLIEHAIARTHIIGIIGQY